MEYLIESQSFPSLAYFHLLTIADHVIIEACENYNKRSFRNRFNLLSSKGKQSFSIPLRKGKNNQTSIREVSIADENPWRKELWHTIKTCYKSAPFYIYYEDHLHDMVFYDATRLLDFNHHVLERCMDLLQINTPVSWSTVYSKQPDCLDMREQIMPQNCLGGMDYARGYVCSDSHLADVSVIDLFMHTGPESAMLIKNNPIYSELHQ